MSWRTFRLAWLLWYNLAGLVLSPSVQLSKPCFLMNISGPLVPSFSKQSSSICHVPCPMLGTGNIQRNCSELLLRGACTLVRGINQTPGRAAMWGSRVILALTLSTCKVVDTAQGTVSGDGLSQSLAVWCWWRYLITPVLGICMYTHLVQLLKGSRENQHLAKRKLSTDGHWFYCRGKV